MGYWGCYEWYMGYYGLAGVSNFCIFYNYCFMLIFYYSRLLSRSLNSSNPTLSPTPSFIPYCISTLIFLFNRILWYSCVGIYAGIKYVGNYINVHSLGMYTNAGGLQFAFITFILGLHSFVYSYAGDIVILSTMIGVL